MKLIISILLTLLMSLNSDLSAETKILAFAGSLRNDSVNKKLIREAVQMAKEMGANITLIDLKDYPMPLYDGDIEQKEGMPEKAKELRRLMVQSQIILIASPEYNASVPGVLKNVIDWASRNEEKGPSREAFKGKKFVMMSASPGNLGGTRALAHLRQIIDNLGGAATAIPQQFSISDAYNAFDAEGHLKNPEQKKELRLLVQTAIQ